MPRHYGSVVTSIWKDEDFRALTESSQRVYLMLITQADITSVGTLSMTLRRWAGYASDGSTKALEAALAELEEARYVVIDWEREELLVRSFVKWDGGYTNNLRLKAIQSSALTVSSPMLQGVLAAEMNKLNIIHAIQVSPIEALSRPLQSHIEGPRVVVTKVTTTPQPLNLEPEPQPGNRPRSERASRLPADFVITPDMRIWAREKVPGLNIEHATDKFINHFMAQSGSRAVMRDWTAAWRKWMLGDLDRNPPRNGHTQSTGEQRAQVALDIAARLDAEERDALQLQIGPGK